MSIVASLFMRAFGRPTGVLGKMGGRIMARTNQACAAWVIGQLGVQPTDQVLEVGFGPGMGIEILAGLMTAGRVEGIDLSPEMIAQATARNAEAIKNGRVALRRGTVESLPFEDDTFDKALAINSMQLWPDVAAGLREIRRVMRPGGRVAFGFTPYSSQAKAPLTEIVTRAGFAEAKLQEQGSEFCVLAIKPRDQGTASSTIAAR
jgi:ubiquinone/menaquinone biosynthesis C-methylase UbiE